MLPAVRPDGDSRTIDALIVGAGPFGLSLAARLAANGLAYRILGSPMSFWKHNMPAGMFLRSSWDWYLDPQGDWTIERFLDERRLAKDDVNPIPIRLYLDYVDWFCRGACISPEETIVTRLDRHGSGHLVVTTHAGETISARNVVLALGFSRFATTPPELMNLFPTSATVNHTVDATDFSHASGRRFLIVGGRQSAYEWAALLAESGASRVEIVHRHPSPAFAEADWTWVPPLMNRMVEDPSWFRSLSINDRQVLRRRLWGEGRLKVEPWLESRIRQGPVTIHPGATITGSAERPNGLDVQMSSGVTTTVDEVIMATGYMPDMRRIDLLSQGTIGPLIKSDNGMPLLDTGFQTSVAGLYMTSLLASRDFGPFFGFTVAARGAAMVLGDHLTRRLA